MDPIEEIEELEDRVRSIDNRCEVLIERAYELEPWYQRLVHRLLHKEAA